MAAARPDQLFDALEADESFAKFGLLPRQAVRRAVERGMILSTEEFEDGQFQPASLDLRLGAVAYRVRASFLPGAGRTVRERLDELGAEPLPLENGATLEVGCVYVIPLIERLKLQDSISAVANPKSSTGRLDIFTRLISDRSDMFDQVAGGYEGPLYAEVSPKSFSVRVRKGSRLNQIRFRRRSSQHAAHQAFALSDRALRQRHETSKLVDGDILLRNGVVLRIALSETSLGRHIGYRAQKHTDVIDVDKVAGYEVAEFWEPIVARRDGGLILNPGEFYILASHEKLHVPPDLAAEMAPIDPAMGEFRVHYAGFFDPGFGYSTSGSPGARAVLEVRGHEVPFILEDGQIVGRLSYEAMADRPDTLYGETAASNYQGQGLKLSKHFRMA